LVTPQIEQMVVYVQGICVGGTKVYPADGNDETVGYWCYDDEGTRGMELLIDQAKEMEADMVVWGQNMNSSWRSMIGPEFNSQANLSWFSGLVARAHNTSSKQHSVEMGVYQLLLNARSASALNQAAPADAIALPRSLVRCDESGHIAAGPKWWQSSVQGRPELRLSVHGHSV
jgi:hypothetical protein